MSLGFVLIERQEIDCVYVRSESLSVKQWIVVSFPLDINVSSQIFGLMFILQRKIQMLDFVANKDWRFVGGLRTFNTRIVQSIRSMILSAFCLFAK